MMSFYMYRLCMFSIYVAMNIFGMCMLHYML